MSVKIENYVGRYGSLYITDTGAHAAPFNSRTNDAFYRFIQATDADAVVNLTGGNMGGTVTNVTIPKGAMVGGIFPTVTRVSGGNIIAYL